MKEEKFAEESRLANQIKRVDAEEAEFFRTLSDEKEKLDHDRKIKEELELAEYRQAVESRAGPSGPAVAVMTPPVAKPKQQSVKTKKSLKGALFVKKRKHESDSEEEVEKKQKTSLSLLADYGDISDSE